MPKTPIAIACSDLHLTLQQPACRADEDWLSVQAEYLNQIITLRNKLNPIKLLPIICAGDIFDRWNPSPELIYFALRNLPTGMYCIPGQHDLPNHRKEEMHRSGYGVLAQAGKIEDLSRHELLVISGTNIVLYPFEWGRELKPLTDQPKTKRGGWFMHIAVVHKYIWIPGASYGHAAPKEARASRVWKELNGYDVAIFGDNHCHFSGTDRKMSLMNTGGFIRRRSDEMGHQPSVGIIYSDGSIERHKLNTSGDRFHENAKEREEVAFNLKEFVTGLEGLGEQGFDFAEAVRRKLKDDEIAPETKEIILKVLNL